MIVGIDIRDLRIAKTGQKTSLEELCRQFRLIPAEECVFVFLNSKFPVYTGRNKLLLLLAHIQLQGWKQLILPLKAWIHNCDIVFCNDYYAPYIHLGFKTVQVFHDAFFYEYPAHYNQLWFKFIFKTFAIPSARRSSFIMVPTFYARETIHQYTHLPIEKLIPIYEGPKSLAPDDGTETSISENIRTLVSKKYILHVGVMEKRKNLPSLIQAFKQVRNQGYPSLQLVLAGQGSGKIYSDDTTAIQQAIYSNHLEDHVLLTGYVSDPELSFLYAHAFLYVFPSFNEGFGIPILEAFQFNLPVLVANNSCLPEVGGDAVITFDPFDIQDMYQKILLVMQDENLRLSLVEKGQQRLQLFSWHKTANELIKLFKLAYQPK